MKSHTYFNHELLEHGVRHKILKPLALFFKVKAMYQHSIIYNYTPNKLARLTGIHHKTAQRYVRTLLKHNLCVLRDGHLLFVYVPHSKGRTKVETRPFTTLNGILERIYLVLLKNNKEQQKYKISCRYGINNVESMNPRLKRKILKNSDLSPTGLENSSKAIITINSVSKLFNTSKPLAQRILKKLSNKRLINLKPYCRKICKAQPLKYFDGLTGYFFIKNGWVWRYVGREIAFTTL